jgi:hypothetical protein
MSEKYTNSYGKTFEFNDHVCMELTLGIPIEKRTGRLVQIRKGVGAFGSDIYFLRLRDGGLFTWENVMMRHVGDERFETAFYTSNGKQPPVIPEQPINPEDNTEEEYTILDKYPETGFIIENPKQPKSGHNSFAMTITSPKK